MYVCLYLGQLSYLPLLKKDMNDLGKTLTTQVRIYNSAGSDSGVFWMSLTTVLTTGEVSDYCSNRILSTNEVCKHKCVTWSDVSYRYDVWLKAATLLRAVLRLGTQLYRAFPWFRGWWIGLQHLTNQAGLHALQVTTSRADRNPKFWQNRLLNLGTDTDTTNVSTMVFTNGLKYKYSYLDTIT